MNFRRLSTFLGSALLLGLLTTSTGCIVVGGGGGGRGGGGGSGGGVGGGVQQAANVTFQWTFAGGTCGQHPEIDQVQITIPGQSIMNSGVFPCTSNGFAGIVLHDFVNGSYTFTVDGQQVNGGTATNLYHGSGSFTVSGQDITVTIDLVALVDNTNSATLAWSFPPLTGIPNPTCTDTGIAQVSYSIDNGQAVTVPCANGNGSSVQQTGHLAPGNHTIAVTAYDAQTCGLYGVTGQFTTFAGNEVPVQLALSYAVGGAVVRWTIEDQSGTQVLTCSQAQLTQVTVNFCDGANADCSVAANWVYPNGDSEACQVSNVQLAQYYCLPPGNYIVNVQGMGGGFNYTTSLTSPPAVTVTAGNFPDQNSAPGPDVANVIMKAQ